MNSMAFVYGVMIVNQEGVSQSSPANVQIGGRIWAEVRQAWHLMATKPRPQPCGGQPSLQFRQIS